MMFSFKQFNADTIKTKQSVFHLNESISHLEDLSPEEFLHNVKNIAQLIASEKLDGANLVVGFDMQGQLYTSREAKGGNRMYKPTTPKRPADNGFCAAFMALHDKQIQPILRSILKNGEAVECELLFGRQPNAIVYGSNYIAFLRAIPGDNDEHPDQSKVKQLDAELKGQSVRVEISAIGTIDGSELIVHDQDYTFKFTSTQFIDSFEFHKVDLKKELHDLEEWLKSNPPSNFKTKKAFAEAASKFMLPIKEKLVDDILRYRKPTLRDVEVEPHEDIGIEGIVVLDPKTGKQFKIIDKSVFTIINQFNYAIRNEIKQTFNFNREAYAHLYKEFSATTGVSGNIYDQMLRGIAQAIGIPGVASYMGITRTIKKYDSPEAFIRAFPQDVNQLRGHIVHAINAGIQHLSESKKHFEANWKSYVLSLGNGREIRYTKEIYNRTLLVYAETLKELTEMLKSVQNSKTVTEIANALFGKQLKAIH